MNLDLLNQVKQELAQVATDLDQLAASDVPPAPEPTPTQGLTPDQIAAIQSAIATLQALLTS